MRILMMAEQLLIDFSKKIPSPVHGENLLPEERAVLSLIREGRQHARQAKEISALTGIRDVEVRSVVAHLVIAHHMLIVSSTSKPAGYYFPVNEEESTAGADQLVHRIRALAVRLKNVKRETYEKIFGQRNYLDDLATESTEKKAG